MTELVTVKGETYDNKIALWERNPAHPSGEAYVADGMIAQVALTPEVQTRLGSGLLVLTDEQPNEPFEGYATMSADKIAAHIEGLGDIERVIVRQYEATHKKRTVVIEATPAPIDGYDSMTVSDVLSAKESMTPEAWASLVEYEAKHKNRKSVIEA